MNLKETKQNRCATEVDPRSILDPEDANFHKMTFDQVDFIQRHLPICQDPNFDRVIISRHSDVSKILSDGDLSVDVFKARSGSYSRRGLTLKSGLSQSMLDTDGKEHARLRRPFAKIFSQRAVIQLNDEIKNEASYLIDAFDVENSVNIVSQYAEILPASIIARIFSDDNSEQVQLKIWTSAIMKMLMDQVSEKELDEYAIADSGLADWVSNKLKSKYTRSPNNIIDRIRGTKYFEQLTEQEIYSNIRQIIVASNMTTTDLIGNCVVALISNRDQLISEANSDDFWAAAVEETLRFDPPIRAWNRQCVREYLIGTSTIPPGQTITASIIAANHDVDLHARPHAFCVRRPSQRHFSFGGGAHFCLGASLARQVSQIGVRELMRRFPDIALSQRHNLIRKSGSASNGYRAIFVDLHHK